MSWNCISLPLNVIVNFTLSPCAGRHLTSSEGSTAAPQSAWGRHRLATVQNELV